MVMATQNPIEYEGTFALPEAELDRFLMRIRLGYPARADELEILDRQQRAHPMEKLVQVASDTQLLEVQAAVREIHLADPLRGYIVDVTAATREHTDIYLGASPRGSLYLFRAAQARALLDGRDFVTPDDIKAMAEPVLAHRLIVTPAARVKSVEPSGVVREILDTIPVPGSRVSVSLKR
jgi:MoxR-like ATPase